MNEVMIVQCAWCGCTMDTSTGQYTPPRKCPSCGYIETFAVSHGICPECKERVMREWREKAVVA